MGRRRYLLSRSAQTVTLEARIKKYSGVVYQGVAIYSKPPTSAEGWISNLLTKVEPCDKVLISLRIS